MIVEHRLAALNLPEFSGFFFGCLRYQLHLHVGSRYCAVVAVGERNQHVMLATFDFAVDEVVDGELRKESVRSLK